MLGGILVRVETPTSEARALERTAQATLPL